MIGFSLRQPIDYQKICREIDGLIKKEIKSQKQAESTILVIRLAQATETQEIQEIKKIESI
jgi:hypothetical protein